MVAKGGKEAGAPEDLGPILLYPKFYEN